MLVVGAGLAALVYFGYKGVGAREASGDERKLVITTASLSQFGIDGLDPKAEKLTSKRSLDGAREIECEYESGEMFFVSNAEIHRRPRDAKESFALTIGAWKTGLALGTTAKIEPAPDLIGGVVRASGLLPGGEQAGDLQQTDDRYAGYIKNDGKIVGNVFLVRNGRVLHSLLISGVYFDDPEDVRTLIAPLIAESTRRFGT
jgi:hypothetical protein